MGTIKDPTVSMMKLLQSCESGAEDGGVSKILKPMSQEDFYRDIEVAEAQF